MGSTIWVEIYDRPLKETANDTLLSKVRDDLDALAVGLHVEKISEFCDWSVMTLQAEAEMRYFEAQQKGEPEPDPTFSNISGAPLAERQSTGIWFDADRGLRVIRAIADHLTSNPEALSLDCYSHDAPSLRARVIGDLRNCQFLLEQASLRKQRFRLLVVP